METAKSGRPNEPLEQGHPVSSSERRTTRRSSPLTAFVAMSRTLAESMKKSLMNHPKVKLTVEPGGQHQTRYWGERFGPAVAFLFPPEPDATK